MHGGLGADTFLGGLGDDYLTGDAISVAGAADLFVIDYGHDHILDLAFGDVADIVSIASGASLSADAYGNWSATAATRNDGFAEVDAHGYNIDLSLVTGSNGWKITDTNTVTGAGEVLTGSANADTIAGGAGNDTLIGGTGSDVLYGGTGDSLVGGNGSDLYVLSGVPAAITEVGTDSDTVQATTAMNLSGKLGSVEVLDIGANSVTLEGADLTDLESIFGSSGSKLTFTTALDMTQANFSGISSIVGSADADSMNGAGFGAAVYFEGGDLGDWMQGSIYGDTLFGGAAADVMTGGGGADQFVYGSLSVISNQSGTAIATADLITDFDGAGGDRIDTNILGSDTNYTEAGNFDTFALAFNAAGTAFTDNNLLRYYLTSSTTDGGLLFMQDGAVAGIDAVIVLTGITSDNFQFSYIV
jgi:Ca2+-binding RTX toxin-like protein